MTSLQRTLDFIVGKPVDVPPLHPIIMQFAAEHSGVKYRDFCLDCRTKTSAMLRCAENYDLDWVTVLSDPYVEAEAFGLKVEYPEDNLPVHVGRVIEDISDIDDLVLPDISSSSRMYNRIEEVEAFSKEAGDRFFIVGWVEGPLAEYVDLRGLSDACLDLYDHEPEVNTAMDLILENAMRFAGAQIAAGAHCIGIGDAACSQIGPALYKSFVFHRQKQLVEFVQSQGAIAKLHICGDTTSILPDMIATGAGIIDVDHLVLDMSRFTHLLGPNQVLSGNSDPVEVVMRGSKDYIISSVRECYRQTAGRGIVSAGCEIPRFTSPDNFAAYCEAARQLSARHHTVRLL